MKIKEELMAKVYKQHIFFSKSGYGKTTEINKEINKLDKTNGQIIENTGEHPIKILNIPAVNLQLKSKLNGDIGLSGIDDILRGRRGRFNVLVIENINPVNLPNLLPLLARYQEVYDIEHLYLSYSIGEY